MWSFLLIGLLAATVIVLVGVNLRQRRSIEALRRAREELQVEENRVFDFLHGLGEAFSDNLRSSDLHRLIVEGATRITDAHGGALYLVDRTRKVAGSELYFEGLPASGRSSAAHFPAKSDILRWRWRVIFGSIRSNPARVCLAQFGSEKSRCSSRARMRILAWNASRIRPLRWIR